jgi:F-type H+-transporting ATPase subunit delta
MNNNHQELHVTADVGAQRVAHVYAEALLNAAEKKGQADSVQEQLDSLVRDLFAKEPQFEAFLSSASVGRDQKTKVIRDVFEKRASDVFFNFLMVLNQHDRLELLRPILAAAREISNQRARRIRVQVRTAVPLADDQQQRLHDLLSQTFRLEPVLEARVDPDLLGGMVLRVGDWLYDASVRTQLENIRNQLMSRSSYEIQSGRNRFSLASGN